MQVKTKKNGKPVGIIVKRTEKVPKKTLKSLPLEDLEPEYEEEIIPEIIGVRVPDDIDDRQNTYRNAQVVNNTLVVKKLLFSYK